MVGDEKFYLKFGSAKDLPSRSRDFYLYRGFEMLPGVLAWVTIGGIFFASWFAPVATSFFIIAFDLYWILKTIFLSLHLRATYRAMKSNLAINWIKKLDTLSIFNNQLSISSWRDIHHLIILPFYKEPYEIIRESLESIKQSRYPKDRLFIVLGIEERAGEEARLTAEQLKKEYESVFPRLAITSHPANIPGELPGKGSNESWAARVAKEKIIDPLRIPYERIIVSTLDSDTRVYPDYFGILTWNYLTCARPLRSSFQPIPVYNNNIWEAPFFSRVVAISGTFWQMMQQARPERLTTFSSHSMPFKSLVEMDYWHRNIVSEDSRIFWQSLLFYNGDWQTIPLKYPVSMDANVGRTSWETIKNVYKQQRRWGWGAENVPYTLFGFLKNKKIPTGKKIFFMCTQIEGFWSWSTNAIIIFLLGRLPIWLGSAQFNISVLSYRWFPFF